MAVLHGLSNDCRTQADDDDVAAGGNGNDLLGQELEVVPFVMPAGGEGGEHVVQPSRPLAEIVENVRRQVVMFRHLVDQGAIDECPWFAAFGFEEGFKFFGRRVGLATELAGDGDGWFQGEFFPGFGFLLHPTRHFRESGKSLFNGWNE